MDKADTENQMKAADRVRARDEQIKKIQARSREEFARWGKSVQEEMDQVGLDFLLHTHMGAVLKGKKP